MTDLQQEIDARMEKRKLGAGVKPGHIDARPVDDEIPVSEGVNGDVPPDPAGSRNAEPRKPLKLDGLALQGEDLRLGLLLKAARERQGLTQGDAASRLKIIYNRNHPEKNCDPVSTSTLSNWETRPSKFGGHQPGVRPFLPAVVELYELSQEEKHRLITLALPPLSPPWLQEQKLEKREGLMMSAYRQLVGISREQAAQILRCNRTLLGNYEDGTHTISEALFEDMIGFYREHCGDWFDEKAVRNCHVQARRTERVWQR